MHTLDVPPLFEDLGHALVTDYFFLREELTEEQLGVLRRVRVFVDDGGPARDRRLLGARRAPSS